MLIKIYPQNPNEKAILQVVDLLKQGELVIIPTDTIYSIACDSNNIKAMERLAKLKGVELEKSNFSFICHDLSHISDYTKPFDTSVYKMMKKALPGPFTFILNAGPKVPSRFFGAKTKKKTLGIRVPDNEITLRLVRELGHPIVSTSIHDDDEIIEYTTDPELIYERYQSKVAAVIDAGFGDNHPSTVIDCTEDEPVLIREGKGDFYAL